MKLNIKALGVQLARTNQESAGGAQAMPEKQTFREQFTAPEMSIISKLMAKVIMVFTLVLEKGFRLIERCHRIMFIYLMPYFSPCLTPVTWISRWILTQKIQMMIMMMTRMTLMRIHSLTSTPFLKMKMSSILTLNRLLGVLCAMPASFCLNRTWKGFFLWQELNIRVRHLYQIFPRCFRHVPF